MWSTATPIGRWALGGLAIWGELVKRLKNAIVEARTVTDDDLTYSERLAGAWRREADAMVFQAAEVVAERWARCGEADPNELKRLSRAVYVRNGKVDILEQVA